jgi:hypothetical protein
MNMRHKGIGIFSALALLMGAHAAFASSTTSFSFESEPGDYIGQGETKKVTAASGTFTINSSTGIVIVTIDSAGEYWRVELAAPVDEKLRPGIYYNAERTAFKTGRSPGLDVSGDGRGCNAIYGKFAIEQIGFDAQGKVNMLDATFEQSCGPNSPSLTGAVKYKADPLSLSYESDPGDSVGQGETRLFTGSTSTFALTGNATSMIFKVSGQRNYFNAHIAAPTGQQLQPGIYQIARFANTTQAGFDFGGSGRGCNSTTGILEVVEVKTGSSGEIKALNAKFEQHCGGAVPALRGAIRFKE